MFVSVIASFLLHHSLLPHPFSILPSPNPNPIPNPNPNNLRPHPSSNHLTLTPTLTPTLSLSLTSTLLTRDTCWAKSESWASSLVVAAVPSRSANAPLRVCVCECARARARARARVRVRACLEPRKGGEGGRGLLETCTGV